MTKKRLLYIGNKLAGRGKNPTSIEILGPLLESEGFEVRYASSASNKIVRLWSMFFSTLRNAFRIDFVLVDTYSTSNFWYAIMVAGLCRILRLKYIPLLHGGNLPQRIKKNPELARFIFAHSFLNVAPSPYLKSVFESEGFQVEVVPNPLMTEVEAQNRSVFRPKLLWVRSFSTIYNPAMAVDVARLLSRDFDDVALYMVGPDVEGNLEKVKTYAQNHGVHVLFTGKLSKKEWMQMAHECDFFINTSNVDNTPFSLIEAASLGLAVVSTDVGGIPYLFKNDVSAVLVPTNDARQMARRISDLVADVSKAQTLVALSKELAQSFKWENIRPKWLEILK
ncbi:glycosyltransferase family 4 protein [Flavobacterium sp. MAH-1]|uniref:Glycosyltransferase family 4 protein n=1 Tax=Flavobacterium agri TaxID=2743471 RepID=A0A7Y8Y1M5_9FLAO|nr:glycosyltransferase family 4 protein [Flavobacterium agri]NUY80907.1 glycosyltransferase family 4 protein [Flavobacterium agri]NYA70931.1 glycosyltransferase family 4 protein [Flavobacterium agri]